LNRWSCTCVFIGPRMGESQRGFLEPTRSQTDRRISTRPACPRFPEGSKTLPFKSPPCTRPTPSFPPSPSRSRTPPPHPPHPRQTPAPFSAARRSTVTRRRAIFLAPHEMQVRSAVGADAAVSLAVRRDFRRDEEVEDLFPAFADDGPLRVNERALVG